MAKKSKKRSSKKGCPKGSRYKVTTAKGTKVSCARTKRTAKCKAKKGQRVVKL